MFLEIPITYKSLIVVIFLKKIATREIEGVKLISVNWLANVVPVTPQTLWQSITQEEEMRFR